MFFLPVDITDFLLLLDKTPKLLPEAFVLGVSATVVLKLEMKRLLLGHFVLIGLTTLLEAAKLVIVAGITF